MSSDMMPEVICKQVIHELSKLGFVYLRKKELQCISSSTYWFLFYLWNYGYQTTLTAAFIKMLEKAKAMMVEEGKLSQVEGSKAIPAINMRRAVPRLPGQDVSAYDS